MVAEHRAGGCINGVFILQITALEIHLVARYFLIQFTVHRHIIGIGRSHTGMLQSCRLGLFRADVSGGIRGRPMVIIRLVCVIRIIHIQPLLFSAAHRTGSAVDFIIVLHAAADKVHLVLQHAVIPFALRPQEGDLALAQAGVLQGSRLGRFCADILTALGVALILVDAARCLAAWNT